MEKILLAIDAMEPDIKSLDFACYMANLTKSKVTGVFLENLVSTENPKKILSRSPYDQADIEGDYSIAEIREKCCEENIKGFKEACEGRGVAYNIHRDRSVPAIEMIEESRFADMIIIDAETSFAKKYEGAPTTFVKDVLADAECPVVIPPHNFYGIHEIIFTYDGSKSSVFAIKQFTYLLPQFNNKKAIILQVNKENDTTVKGKYKLKEWLKAHYSNIDIVLLEGDSRYKLFDYILKQKNAFIVMGAYGRNMIANFFSGSHADFIVKVIDLPVFIAHY
jgi:hypothetical protein